MAGAVSRLGASGAHPPHAATGESPWVRYTLITVAVLFLALFLFVPLASVFYEALRKGADTYLSALTEPDAVEAIELTLTVAANMRTFWLHLIRVSVMHFLLVATWFVALPAIGVGTWLVLGALRLVIGRMPVPNKELLFAALAVSLTGDASAQVAALMAAQGVLYLGAHGLSWLMAIAIDESGPDEIQLKKGNP